MLMFADKARSPAARSTASSPSSQARHRPPLHEQGADTSQKEPPPWLLPAIAPQGTRPWVQRSPAAGGSDDPNERAADATDSGARDYTGGSDLDLGPDNNETGERLLAHETPHVGAQQPGSAPSSLPGSTGTHRTHKARPELELRQKDAPCACLVFIHGNENNARDMAEALQAHCHYNLAIIKESKARRVLVGGGKVDPNSLFDEETARMCMDDEDSCRQFLTEHEDAKKEKHFEKWSRIQFFMAISQCSNKFQLPVVALHNNVLKETELYYNQRAKLPEKDRQTLDAELKGTREESAEKDRKGKDPGVKDLRQKITSALGKEAATAVLDEGRMTNIFRWCNFDAVPELSKCHIGDPAHPDHVVWTTNKEDFDRLAAQNINVTYQGEMPNKKRDESAGDLSTLFLILKGIHIGRMLDAVITMLEATWNDSEQAAQRIRTSLHDILEGLKKQHKDASQAVDVLLALLPMLKRPMDVLIFLQVVTDTEDNPRFDALKKRLESENESIAALRYINIETPSERMAQGKKRPLDKAARRENFDFVLKVLSAANLDCCDTKAEDEARTHLDLNEEPAKQE